MDWKDRLALAAHPEGGFFRRIHSSEGRVQTPQGERHAATAIHYLLTREHPRARFHRVRSTILHFLQSGGPVQYACIDAAGGFTETTLGFAAGQGLFLEVKPGVWKASRLCEGAGQALVSEVVVPGFDWADHDYLDPAALPAGLQRRLHDDGWI